jgi:hypothetical protein
MNDAFAKVIAELQEQMRPLELQLIEKKKLINQLCAAGGDALLYPDVGEVSAVSSSAIRPDQFFGRALATVVREIMEGRKAQNKGAIPLDELFDQMKSGGFQFDNKNEQIAKRNLSISLGKNAVFIRVPNTGTWGLAEWYPNAKRAKPTDNAKGIKDEADDDAPSQDDTGANNDDEDIAGLAPEPPAT